MILRLYDKPSRMRVLLMQYLQNSFFCAEFALNLVNLICLNILYLLTLVIKSFFLY